MAMAAIGFGGASGVAAQIALTRHRQASVAAISSSSSVARFPSGKLLSAPSSLSLRRFHPHPLFHRRVPHVAQDTAQTESKEEEQEVEEDDAKAEGGSQGVSEEPTLTVQALLGRYKEALSNQDEEKIVEIDARLVALQEERDALLKQTVALTEEGSTFKDRLLRLTADFDNFRKRSERDRLAMASTAKGDVIEDLLPIIDNFERAQTQIKIETEAEQKINTSYQGIYKQFVDILKGMGVSVVETVGKEFDPNMHEAIMRDESSEYEEGIVLEEFRRGFMLDERLLRPAMVKVSAGPGPSKTESTPSEVTTEQDSEGDADSTSQ